VINKRRWRVKQVKGLARRTGAVGLCDSDIRLIRIDAGISQKDKEITLLHEVLHAIFPYNLIGNEKEEKILTWIDTRLHAVIVKNRLF
jgi:hypothetical protein